MAAISTAIGWMIGVIGSVIVPVIILFVLAFVCFVIKRAWWIIKELIILRNLAFAGRTHRGSNPKDRLLLFACTSDRLSEVCIEEMYRFGKNMMESTVTLQQFRVVIYSYKYVFLFRDRMDGTLCGMFLMGYSEDCQQGVKYTVIKLGLAFFKSHYRGSSLLYAAVLYHTLKQLLRHPTRPVYIIGKSFSYRSYLLAVRNFKAAWPRFDCPEIPPFEKRIMDEFGHSNGPTGKIYIPKTCVLKREATKLKINVAPINDDLLNNPHVKYFQELNPEWQKGHCLVTMVKVEWLSLLGFAWRTLRRVLPCEKQDKRPKRNRSSSHFLSEKDFLQKQGDNKNHYRYSVLDGCDILEVAKQHEKSRSQSLGEQAVSNISRTTSIELGVDRIDEYSEIDFG